MKDECGTKKFCYHCICKTCLLAEVNGGAPGCGDCYKCSREGYNLFCQSCFDYYNYDSAKGMSLNYCYQKAIESGELKPEEEVILSKEELEWFAEELRRAINERPNNSW